MHLRASLIACCLAAPLQAQIQVRLGDSTRTTYSELHEALRPGTPAWDSTLAIMSETRGAPLWARLVQAVQGKRPWNDGLLALTRLAELREPSSADSVHHWRTRIENGRLKVPATEDPESLLPALHAIELELKRPQLGDLALLADLLGRVPGGGYDLGDAWVFGRLREGAADSVARRFLDTADQALRIRYLTLLSFSTDTSLIPFFSRVYAAPDSFKLPKRIGVRASDGLIWIGTRSAVSALLSSRDAARSLGTYADPRLGHADLDFLGSDSSAVLSRTGRWLTDWLQVLKQ